MRVWHNGPFPALPIPGARVSSSGENLGFGEGVNRLLLEAEEDVLVVANPDLVLDPGCVAALSAALTGSEAVVAGGLLLSPEGRVNAYGLRLTFDLLGVNTDRGREAGAFLSEPPGEDYLGPSGALFAVHRGRLRAQAPGPLFPAGLFLYLEDVALWLRLRARGCAICFCPAARAVHGWSATTGQRSLLKLHYVERNRLWLCRALWGTPGALATLPFTALRYAAYLRGGAGAGSPGVPGAARTLFGALRDGLFGALPDDVRAFLAGVRVRRSDFACFSEQLRNPVA